MKSILLLSIPILLFFACEKGGKKSYYITNEEVKKSVSFNEGSYFIYRDSVNGNTDSIRVFLSTSWMMDVLAMQHQDPLYIEIYRYSLINKDSIMGYVEVQACDGGCNNYKITGFPAVAQPIPTNIRPVFYSTDFQVNQKVSSNVGYSILKNYHDSILFNGNQHYKVYQVFSKGVYSQKPFDSTEVTTYYSLEEGILKYSVRTDNSYQSWELLNNHIIL